MSLYTVATGSTIQAQDINQMVSMLQQPAGGQETGNYYLHMWNSAASQQVGTWIALLSHNSTPVSVSTVSLTSLGFTSYTTDTLKSSGFHFFASSSGAANSNTASGTWTVQF